MIVYLYPFKIIIVISIYMEGEQTKSIVYKALDKVVRKTIKEHVKEKEKNKSGLKPKIGHLMSNIMPTKNN